MKHNASSAAVRKVKLLFYDETSVDNRGKQVLTNGTKTNTATLNPLTDSQRRKREQKKWHRVVLTLIERHEVPAVPFLT